MKPSKGAQPPTKSSRPSKSTGSAPNAAFTSRDRNQSKSLPTKKKSTQPTVAIDRTPPPPHKMPLNTDPSSPDVSFLPPVSEPPTAPLDPRRPPPRKPVTIPAPANVDDPLDVISPPGHKRPSATDGASQSHVAKKPRIADRMHPRWKAAASAPKKPYPAGGHHGDGMDEGPRDPTDPFRSWAARFPDRGPPQPSDGAAEAGEEPQSQLDEAQLDEVQPSDGEPTPHPSDHEASAAEDPPSSQPVANLGNRDDDEEENTKPHLLTENDLELLDIALQEFNQSPSRLRWPKSYDRWRVLRKGNPGPTPSMMRVAAELHRLQEEGDPRFKDVFLPDPSPGVEVSQRPQERPATSHEHANASFPSAPIEQATDSSEIDLEPFRFETSDAVERRNNPNSWVTTETKLLFELMYSAEALAQPAASQANHIVAKMWPRYVDGKHYLKRTAGGLDSRIRFLANARKHPLHPAAARIRTLYRVEPNVRLAQARPLPVPPRAVSQPPPLRKPGLFPATTPDAISDPEQDLASSLGGGIDHPAPARTPRRPSKRPQKPRKAALKKHSQRGASSSTSRSATTPSVCEEDEDRTETETESGVSSIVAQHTERIKRLETNMDQLIESHRKLVARLSNAEGGHQGSQSAAGGALPLKSSLKRNGGATPAQGHEDREQDELLPPYSFNPHQERMMQQQREWQARQRRFNEEQQAVAQQAARGASSNLTSGGGGGGGGRDASPQGQNPAQGDYRAQPSDFMAPTQPAWTPWGPVIYAAPPMAMGGEYGMNPQGPPSRVWGNATPYRPY